jgi:hypothetical protein
MARHDGWLDPERREEVLQVFGASGKGIRLLRGKIHPRGISMTAEIDEMNRPHRKRDA